MHFVWKIPGEKGAICPILLRVPYWGQEGGRKASFLITKSPPAGNVH